MRYKLFQFTHSLDIYSRFIAMLVVVVGAAMLMMLTLSQSAGAQTGSTLRIDPATISLELNDTLDFSMVIDIEAGKDYGNGSYTISYDSTVLRLDSFEVGSSLFGVTNTNTAGIIRFNGLSVTGETGTVILGSGRFTAISKGDSTLTIGIVDVPGDSSGSALPDVAQVNGSASVEAPSNTPTVTPTNTPVVPTPTSTPVATPSENLNQFIYLPVITNN